MNIYNFFFFQAEDGIRDPLVTGVQTCALPISCRALRAPRPGRRRGCRYDSRRMHRRPRSEERRVGKECRSRWSPHHQKKKKVEKGPHRRPLFAPEKKEPMHSRTPKPCLAPWQQIPPTTSTVAPPTVTFFFSSRRRHTRSTRDWSSDVCSSD